VADVFNRRVGQLLPKEVLVVCSVRGWYVGGIVVLFDFQRSREALHGCVVDLTEYLAGVGPVVSLQHYYEPISHRSSKNTSCCGIYGPLRSGIDHSICGSE